MDERTDGARRFKRFLERHKLTLAAAGESLGVSGPTILDWRRGRKRPTAHYRKAIETWTAGAVPEVAWMTADEAAALNVAPFVAP